MLWCVFGGCANGSSLWVDLHVPVQKLLFGRKGQGQAFPWRRCSADGRALLTRLIYLWRIQGIHWGFGTAVRVLKEEQKIVLFVHTVQRQWITQTPLLLVIFLKNQDRSVSSECKLVITYRLFFCWSDLLIVRVGFRDGIRSVFVQLWAFGIALDEKQREGYIKRHNREHFTTKKYANTATIFLLPSNY